MQSSSLHSRCRLFHDDLRESGLLPVTARAIKNFSGRTQPTTHAQDLVQTVHVILRMLERLNASGGAICQVVRSFFVFKFLLGSGERAQLQLRWVGHSAAVAAQFYRRGWTQVVVVRGESAMQQTCKMSPRSAAQLEACQEEYLLVDCPTSSQTRTSAYKPTWYLVNV